MHHASTIQMQSFTQHLTVVPSTKGWCYQFGGRSWLLCLYLEGKCTVWPHYWLYYSAPMPLFNLAELYIVAENIQPSIFGSTISRNISENRS
ncbi:hypothetical protein ACN42_g4105 [Penicillium freii]|uniref:Uncharacterized protein n=1 Tax=Penicillium freii TaxID=48697 RepID=A0A101MM17_PENFR|nr:hypothetical protein ACN42_g4105 [Penicillium freii]